MESKPEKPKKPERKPDEGKKTCGMCGYKIARQGGEKEWYCTHPDAFTCPVPQSATGQHICCPGFSAKPRKPRPTQLKPARLTIPAGVRFIYFGRPGPGVMTVAYSIHEKSQTIEMGYSFCSPMDNWIKAKGQDIALRRLNQRAVVANYLYEPRRLVVQIAQAMMERRFKNLGDVLFTFPGDLKTTVPGWSRDLARRLKVRTWECLVPKVNWPITKKVEDEILSFVFRRRPTADHIMARMVQDILNLGGGL